MGKDSWNPEQYDKFKAQRSKPFFDLLAKVDPEGVRSAVDLGCGTGELTAELARRLPEARVLGLDRSDAMLSKSAAFAAPNLRFEKADISKFSPAAPVDLVFSNAALQWVPRHESAFSHILAFVAPGGQFAAQMPTNYDHASHAIAHELARDYPELRALPPHGVLGVEDYARILYQAGFRDPDCRVQVYVHPMASGAEVVEWTKGSLLTAFQSLLEPAAFEEFLSRYRERLLARIGEGPYVYGFKRLLLWGRRS
jgi:trans-aconitate 2-methyltransferase